MSASSLCRPPGTGAMDEAGAEATVLGDWFLVQRVLTTQAKHDPDHEMLESTLAGYAA